ncbi:uncharacterized protein LOC131439448 [Malaya genurostris]|uniref:uncharacterized protein LOC131439448 n=1 Tax=Malaya genurostris TaxID=325434 RepID=UPI0026F3B045|nr:uncharacterized protein LOC131439448 [Malaya genurostris]
MQCSILGRTVVDIVEAPDPPSPVVPPLPAFISRPGPAASRLSSADLFYPVSQNDEQDDVGIWVYYQNVRGLRTKIDEIFLTTSDCNFDVIFLTETGLDSRINSQQLFGNSFNVFRCDRSSANSDKASFGGVLIAVSRKHVSSIIETVNGQCLEQVCASATVRGRKLLLCGVYIPPDKSQNVDVIDAHISTVPELCSKGSVNDIVLVCGDFNQPRIVWNQRHEETQPACSLLPSAAGTALIDGMDFLNLHQANQCRNHLGRLLDLVFCSSEHQLIVDCSVTPLLPVDPHHPPLVISLAGDCENNFRNMDFTNESRPLNYRKIDFGALLEFLQNVNWSALQDIDNANEMAYFFCNKITQWLSSNLPFVKRPISPPWSTALLRKLKRIRNAWQRKHRRWKSFEIKRMFKSSSDNYRKNSGLL